MRAVDAVAVIDPVGRGGFQDHGRPCLAGRFGHPHHLASVGFTIRLGVMCGQLDDGAAVCFATGGSARFGGWVIAVGVLHHVCILSENTVDCKEPP